MRPLNNRFFGVGNGKIAIIFHNGSNVVNGYIVKQMGTTSYIVSDGTIKKQVWLAQDTATASMLASFGAVPVEKQKFATVTTQETNKRFIKNIRFHQLITTDGDPVFWGLYLRITTQGDGTAPPIVVSKIGLDFSSPDNSQYLSLI